MRDETAWFSRPIHEASTSLNWNVGIVVSPIINIINDLWWSNFMIFGDLAWKPSKWFFMIKSGDLSWLITIYHDWSWQITIQLGEAHGTGIRKQTSKIQHKEVQVYHIQEVIKAKAIFRILYRGSYSEARGDTRSRKVWVCEAGPPDPPYPFHSQSFEKKTPLSTSNTTLLNRTVNFRKFLPRIDSLFSWNFANDHENTRH